MNGPEVEVADHDGTRGGAGAAAVGRPVVIDGRSPPLTSHDLHADVLGLRRRVPRGATVALVGQSSRLVASAIVALEGWAARVEFVGDLSPTVGSAEAVVLREAGDDAPAAAYASHGELSAGDASTDVRTLWRVFSSGTTGTPTPTDHSLDSLTRRIRPVRPARNPGDREQRRWGLLFSPTRMAGIQVVLQAIHGDTLVDAHHAAGLDERLQLFAGAGIDALSATPTMWRMILRSRACDDLRLQQITLGGEIATQSLINALRRRFDARVTHVYASTEAGAAFSVSDGREGFPRHFLEPAPGRVALEIRDGILFVRAPGSSTAQPDGFVCTGDLVEPRGDRVYFVGRKSQTVNVGGDKVSPERVEELIRRHPAVHDAVVTPRRSPITGWILTARVVPSPLGSGLDPDELQSALRSFVADHLPRSHTPASITAVTEFFLSPTGKVSRA
ncbi:AMP-binding protein [Micromonospora sp. D75]|uniref:AMP-binding protein n=1 Tax=Micromonospora sp. D75 TaxID=2824885 RepID=UPI001B35FB1B|nr:AMP-binding protein [Micromonospora sp. D75]MBQ1065335.1 AMP-binding protein [Micromonospora sp. D75]